MKLPVVALRKTQQRPPGRRRVPPVPQKQHDRQQEQREHLAPAERMLAEDLEHVRQQPDPRPEQNQTRQVEPVGALGPIVGQIAIDEIETQKPDRQVDEEDHPPVEVTDDQTAGQRPEQRPDQTRDGDEAHRADQLGAGEGPHNGEPSDRHHHRPAAPLQDPAEHQHMNVRRDAAEERPDREQPDRPCKDPARAEPIRHPAADRDEDREAQRVAGEHRLHAQRRHAERRRDCRHRRVQDGGVERLHEEGDRHQPGQEPLDGIVRGGWGRPMRGRGHALPVITAVSL